MARITVEDCLKNINNRYELVHAATHRARQLCKGSSPLLDTKNREVVTALREIASKYVHIVAASEVQDEDEDQLLPQ